MMTSTKEKRNHERLNLHGLIADIADGNHVYDGLIEDVSAGGFKITQLPARFDIRPHNYITVISGYNKNFKIVIQPRWTKKTHGGYFREVGFKIVNPPWEWTEFILDMMPEKKSDDAW